MTRRKSSLCILITALFFQILFCDSYGMELPPTNQLSSTQQTEHYRNLIIILSTDFNFDLILSNALEKPVAPILTTFTLWSQTIKDRSFNHAEWKTYYIDDFVLLVPQSYENKILNNIQSEGKPTDNFTDHQTGNMLDYRDIKLGLKLSQIESSKQETMSSLKKYAYLACLAAMVVAKNIYETFTEIMLGGRFSLHYFSSQICEFIPIPTTFHNYDAQIINILKKIIVTNQDVPEGFQPPSWQLYLIGHGFKRRSQIAKLSIQGFHDFLQFWEHEVNTALLVYTSCFAGWKKHVTEPYLHEGLPYPYSYIIACCCTTDTPVWGLKLRF